MPKETTLKNIEEKIYSSSRPLGMSTRIISIDGCGGAGKSTFADRLSKHFDDCSIIHTDEFASWDNPLNWCGRMLEQVMNPLRLNQPANYQRYDWNQQKLTNWITIEPQSFIIIEGVSSSRREFREFLAFSIFIETASELRLQRGIERDGVGSRERWLNSMKDEDTYVDRDRPAEFANLVISGNTVDDKIFILT